MAEVGRPLKFNSVEELQSKIDEYFKICEETQSKPLISELALHLDTSRETLSDYKDKPEYSDSLKKAKQKCEIVLERNLVEGKVNPTGTIFNLKNNYGWRDKTEIEHSGEITENQNIVLDPERQALAKKVAEEIKKNL